MGPVAVLMPFRAPLHMKKLTEGNVCFRLLQFLDRELTLSNLLGFDRSPLQGAFATVDIHLKKLYNYISK